MIDWYEGPCGREAMMRFGPAGAPVVIAALPPFEEYNRTRTFMVGLLRRLAASGIASVLPDLPGMGESIVPTVKARLTDWRAGFAAAADASGARASIALRGGALVDGAVGARWHLAPQPGAALVRELHRIEPTAAHEGEAIEVAGNLLSTTLLDELQQATPAAARVVRLESDPKPADRHVPGAPLWRRVEPDDDPVLAQILADDIGDWLRSCAA